jgi:DNA-binding NarL/FixJ family response regulator
MVTSAELTTPLSYELRSSRYAAPRLELIMLSDRQREVTLFVAEGLSNKEIARRLEISECASRRWSDNRLLDV